MDSKTHILIETETYVQTAQMTYEAFHSFEKFCNITPKVMLTKNINSNDIEWADIVISIRGANNLSATIGKMCRKYKRFYCVSIDDNLFIHERNDRFMQSRQNELRRILNMAQVAIVCNENYKKWLYDDYGVKRFALTDTSVEEELIHSYIEKGKKLGKDSPLKLVYYSNDGGTGYAGQGEFAIKVLE